MNKLKVTKRAIFFLSLSYLIGSCSDFLDEDPDNRVALETLDNAAQLLVSAYSIASPNFTDWMSDDVAEYTIGTNRSLSHDQIYTWEDVTTGPTEQDTPDFFWFETYNAISHANEVLAILDELPVDTEDDLARKDAIEAEALLTRAYGHYMLVNMFSEHFYNAWDSDPGVPYIKEPETEFLAEYERDDIEDVYEEIEDDLLRGLDLVDDRFYENSGKYHFNRNAALAFASRFYLNTGDFIRCLQYSDELLGSNPGAFIRDLTSEEFQLASGSTTEYPRLYTSPDQSANLLLIRKISLVQRTDFAFGPEQNFYNGLFADSPFGGLTDERENPAFVKGQNAVYPARYESLFERSSLNSNVGFPYYIHLAFTGEEVVLNRAESNTRLGNLDEAIVDLQALSDKRYSGGTPELTIEVIRNFLGGEDDELNLLIYIIEVERRKEFIMQGMRWNDIKRFGFSIQHVLANGQIIQLENDDNRKILQIPQSAIDVGGLDPNPR